MGDEVPEQLLVPASVGRHQHLEEPAVPQDQLRAAIYSQLLTRVYADGRNPPVMLLIAQSGTQTGILQVHRPEFCYTASGYRISSVVPHPIALGGSVLQASGMDATSGATPEHVVYWTRVGNRIPRNWTQQKLAVAELNLQGIIPDAILVRISCVTEDSGLARQTIDDFVRALLASIPLNKTSVFIA